MCAYICDSMLIFTTTPLEVHDKRISGGDDPCGESPGKPTERVSFRKAHGQGKDTSGGENRQNHEEMSTILWETQRRMWKGCACHDLQTL